MPDELKPCVRCGAEGKVFSDDGHTWAAYCMGQTSCGLKSRHFLSIGAAMDWWNWRKEEAPDAR